MVDIPASPLLRFSAMEIAVVAEGPFVWGSTRKWEVNLQEEETCLRDGRLLRGDIG